MIPKCLDDQSMVGQNVKEKTRYVVIPCVPMVTSLGRSVTERLPRREWRRQALVEGCP